MVWHVVICVRLGASRCREHQSAKRSREWFEHTLAVPFSTPADSGFHVGPSSTNGNFFWIDVHFENDSKDHVSAGASVDLSLRSASDVPRNLGIKYMHKNNFLLPQKQTIKMYVSHARSNCQQRLLLIVTMHILQVV